MPYLFEQAAKSEAVPSEPAVSDQPNPDGNDVAGPTAYEQALRIAFAEVSHPCHMYSPALAPQKIHVFPPGQTRQRSANRS